MGMGVHHYLRVLVQVWLSSPVEGGGGSMEVFIVPHRFLQDS